MAGAECIVVAVDYRKEPEHLFPVPLSEWQAALTWAVEQAYPRTDRSGEATSTSQ